MRTVLRNARWIWTGARLLERAHVSIVDGRIESVQAAPIDAAAELSPDLDGCLLMPGLISLHHHFFQHVTRAWPGLHRAPSEGWLGGMYPVWGRMEAADIAAAARAAAAELLLSGTTTSVDHAFLLRASGDERLAAQIEAVRALGLRQHIVRSGLPSLPARFSALLDAEGPLLEQCRADVSRWHDPARGAMLRLDLGPSNVPYDKPALMRALADLAAEHGCGLHVHFHPRRAERELSRRLSGAEPIDFLDAAGWLRPGTWFAHCTELDDRDIARMAERGVGIAHCPRTVLRLGYRVPALHRWRASGVRVAFGADGGASNDAGAFLADVRLALLLHRAGTAGNADPQRDWLEPADALAMATREAAAILRRPELGSLEAGACADLAAFDLRGVDVAGALNDPLAGFLLAGSATRAKLTMVNGVVRVLDGKLVGADEHAIAAECNERSRALFLAG
ncbi:MAG: amidohydrolase family protein [Betaproteobacteria bacterium]